jgi:hypothetical protein
MSTVNILELPYITEIQSNTANTVLVGVDVPSDTTGQITLTTIAGNLYSNNNLKVGNNDIIYANAVGQFTGNSTQYLQVAVRNQDGDGSGDFVITADDGTDGTHFLDLGLNGSTYSDPDYSATKAHDGYLYVNTNDAEGNLVIGTTSSFGRINFIVGGTESSNIVSHISSAGIFSPSINSLVAANVATLRGEILANADSANSVINSRISANVATLRGEITANADSANSVINSRISANVATLRGEITANADSANSVINSRISSNIATANLFTQASFDKANNAIANTNGVYTAGDFYISGDGFVNGTFILANSTFGVTEAAMTIKATATVQTPSQSGTMLHISGKANTPSRIIFDSFSTDGSAYGIVAGRTARGTVSSPTATQNNDILMRLAGNGWGTTGFAPLGVARIDIVATENYTDSARGSRIIMYNVKNGTNTVSQIASFNANTIEFTGTVAPEKGFIYTPTVLPGSQTAFTIDFSTTSLIKANVAADCTITLSNYVYGKVVEVWLTNTSGSNRTITHGCIEINSTVNSTTFTIPATSSAYLRYFSVDGDNANTFVAVQHA